MPPHASVIIPVFNAEKTIENCLASILNQTVTRTFEVIAVNDGSTDSTLKLLERLKHPKLRIVNQSNAGPAKARNAGATIALGDILLFTDSDCIADPNWLNQMVEPFADPEVAGVQGAYRSKQKEWIAQFIQIEIEHRYERPKQAKNLDWVGSYSAAYRKNIFMQVHGFDENFSKASGEDPELSFKIQKAGKKLVFNPNAIIYHQHPTRLAQYLKKKFQHAYWRVLLYRKHSDKIVKDTYTPESLKLQLALTLLFPLAIAVVIYQGPGYTVLPGVITLLLALAMSPFVLFAARKNIFLGLMSPLLLLLRNIVFLAGLGCGLLKIQGLSKP